jgi:hypothetical protein
MNRTLPIIVGLIASSALVGGQGVTPAPSVRNANAESVVPVTGPAMSAPEPTPSLGNPVRSVSPAVSAEISFGMPAYSVAPSPPNRREVDKPRNQIPRLSPEVMEKYVVREVRLPVFRTRDLYTKAGLIDLSFKEHPGLRLGNLFNLNANFAYDKIITEQLYAARQDLADTTFAMAAMGDKTELDAMQQAIIDDGFNQESPVGK